MDSVVYRYSDRVNGRTVREMADIAARAYLRCSDTRSLSEIVNEVVHVRFSDHPLYFRYREQTQESAAQIVDRERQIERDSMIRDAKRLGDLFGYPEMEARDLRDEGQEIGRSFSMR